MRCISFARTLAVVLATFCAFMAHGSTNSPCNFLLGSHHPFTALASQAFLFGAIPLDRFNELAQSNAPFNPVFERENPFHRGFQLALQRRNLLTDWPIIVMELREFHSMFAFPAELQVKEIFRIRNADSVTAPVMTLDKLGRPLIAFQSADGLVRVHRVGEKSDQPTWVFPRRDIPVPFDSQFVHLAWQPDKNGGEPWLFVYWLPINDDNDEHPTPTLHRAAARLGDRTAQNVEAPVPRAGFVEAVQSFGFDHEFFLFTPVADEEPRLVDMNSPARPSVKMGMPPAPGMFATSQTGTPLLVRIEKDDVRVLQRTIEGWRTVWRERCPGECVEASIYKSESGELWVAYMNSQHRLTVQSIHNSESRLERAIGNPVMEPPRFFETREGHIYLLLEAQSGSLVTIPVSGPAEGSAAIEFPNLSHFFLSSSRVFRTGGSNRVYLGLMSVTGLSVMNPLGGPLSPLLARVPFEGNEKVAWLETGEQTYLVVGSNPRQSELVVYRMLSWR